MTKLSPQGCLGAWTRRQGSARLLPRLVTAGRTPGPGLGTTASQTRRLHHQTRNTGPRTLPSGHGHPSRPAARTHNLHPLPPPPSTPSTHRPYTTTPRKPPSPTIHSLFDPQTSTWQYLVADPSTHTAAI